MKPQEIDGIKCGRPHRLENVKTGRMLAYMFKKHPDVKYARDALEPVQIELSPRDIRDGIPKDHERCAFAHAACRIFKTDAVFVGNDMACVKMADSLVRFKLCPRVALEAAIFDRTKTAVPDKTFRFSAVPPLRRLGRVVRKAPGTGKKKPAKNGKGFYVKKGRSIGIRKPLTAV